MEFRPSTPLMSRTLKFPTLSECRFVSTKNTNTFYREDIITADVSIENLVIRNLSTFDTKLAHLDLEKLALALELSIDDLRVKQFSQSVILFEKSKIRLL